MWITPLKRCLVNEHWVLDGMWNRIRWALRSQWRPRILREGTSWLIVSSVYDPLGFACPVILQVKNLLQKYWVGCRRYKKLLACLESMVDRSSKASGIGGTKMLHISRWSLRLPNARYTTSVMLAIVVKGLCPINVRWLLRDIFTAPFWGKGLESLF